MKPETLEDEGNLLSLQSQLCFALYSATHAFTRRYKPLLDQLGLTYAQYLCMIVLWEMDDIPVKAIGEKLHLDSGTLTPLLKRLETRGLVRRTRDARDERQVRISLTEAGSLLRGQAVHVPGAMLCASGRTREDVGAVLAELNRMRDALDAPA